MQAVGLEPLYRVPGVRVMPPLMPKNPSTMDGMRGGGGGMGPLAARGLGSMMRPMAGAGGGYGSPGLQHGMPGGNYMGMGGGQAGKPLGQYGGPMPAHMGGGGMPGHHLHHSGQGPGSGLPDPHGLQGLGPAPSPFAARHQQLASPGGAGSDYGGGYGSGGGSDLGASPGPRLGSEAHTPGRRTPSDQACLPSGFGSLCRPAHVQAAFLLCVASSWSRCHAHCSNSP